MKTLTQIRTLCCSNSAINLGIISVAILLIGCTSSPEKRPSPLRLDSAQIANGKVFIEYSSPRVRGRKIFGLGEDYLEQYGEVWRTGANDATVFTTEVDLMVDTFLISKGKYALFTIPNPDQWEIIINSEWDQWGSYYRKDSLDVARFFVDVTQLDSVAEQMTFYFEGSSLKFIWDKTGWAIPIRQAL